MSMDPREELTAEGMAEIRRKNITPMVAKPYRLPGGPPALDAALVAAAAVPFRDDRPMDGTSPSYTAVDFKTPRLRKCLFDLSTIDWRTSSRLDGGLDGYAWKVWFKKDGPYVLKVVRRRIVTWQCGCSFPDSICPVSFGTQSPQHLAITLPHSESARMLPCSR